MTDRILIKDLLLRTIIGIKDEERRAPQDVLINITLHADTRVAGQSDDIEHAVNYRTITKRVIKLVEGSQFFLVEKMAAEIAAICLDDPRVQRANIRVEKPGALRFARSVGIEIERHREASRSMNRVLISLGSNIEPETNLIEAVRRLAMRCRLLAVSPVYETEPVGTTDQASFLNAAVLVETDLTPGELKMEVLRSIEDELGRHRTADKNAPRTIDLDISLYNEEVFELGKRHVPDPEILEFLHIVQPLADLAPYYRHPETGQTLLDIAQSVPGARLERRNDCVLWPGE